MLRIFVCSSLSMNEWLIWNEQNDLKNISDDNLGLEKIIKAKLNERRLSSRFYAIFNSFVVVFVFGTAHFICTG